MLGQKLQKLKAPSSKCQANYVGTGKVDMAGVCVIQALSRTVNAGGAKFKMPCVQLDLPWQESGSSRRHTL